SAALASTPLAHEKAGIAASANNHLLAPAVFGEGLNDSIDMLLLLLLRSAEMLLGYRSKVLGQEADRLRKSSMAGAGRAPIDEALRFGDASLRRGERHAAAARHGF